VVRYRPKVAYRVSRDIALLFLNLGTRKGWVVCTTPRPLYPRERPDTHCTRGWVGLRAGVDVCEKSRPHRDSIPGLSVHSQSLYRLSYPAYTKYSTTPFIWTLVIRIGLALRVNL
jgi:hypothetical protein